VSSRFLLRQALFPLDEGSGHGEVSKRENTENGNTI
jgi:hypothetical protein